MKPLRTSLLAFLSLAPLFALAAPAAPKPFTAPPLFEHEVVGISQLLDNAHYNRDAVLPSSFSQLIPDYMGEYDSQRLFFLESDREEFAAKYPANWLYNNITTLGKISPAFVIYERFQERANARIGWLLEELKKDIDLTSSDAYTIDRSKGPWPTTTEEADALWRQRLKFELIQEILAKKTLEKAKTDLTKRYERMQKNLAETEASELCEIFLSCVTRLYDPHSTYFSADTFEDFAIQMRLQLTGIGAVLGIEDDLCVVKELVAGGPADISKQIKPNDKIVAVAQGDDEFVDIVGMKLRKIVEMVRGQKNTQVRLMIQSGTDETIRREVIITRDVVNLNSARARGAIYDLPQPGGTTLPVGVITLPAFYGPDGSSTGDDNASASGDVAKLITQLKAQGIQGLVLDLRQNGGGLLNEAIDLVGLFIPDGPVVQVRNYYGEVGVSRDEDKGVAYDGPLAVLVSRFSASASEIAAGALQNYGRAIIIGDSSTHGKGSVQQLVPMRDIGSAFARANGKAGAVKLTIQKFYLPNGHSTQLNGVVPDIVLPSIDDFLPIGEKDLPRALVWDEIPTTVFNGSPLDASLTEQLRTNAKARQASLPEFSFIQKNIDWFKAKQEIKAVSLNLEERQRLKAEDVAFRKAMDAQRLELAQNNFPFREFNLGAKPQPNLKAKSDEEDPDGFDDDLDETKRVDVHLRESLRVIADAISLGRTGETAAKGPMPLSLAAVKKN